MKEITDDRYWDCECEYDYINKKSEREHCGWCDTNMKDQPDSIKKEIKKDIEHGTLDRLSTTERI
tara:strand:- start:752 stop:946 length:195 start_codon:yes stop_codon:yes gene_type:complete